MMQRIFQTGLLTVLLVGFIACGGGNDAASSEELGSLENDVSAIPTAEDLGLTQCIDSEGSTVLANMVHVGVRAAMNKVSYILRDCNLQAKQNLYDPVAINNFPGCKQTELAPHCRCEAYRAELTVLADQIKQKCGF